MLPSQTAAFGQQDTKHQTWEDSLLAPATRTAAQVGEHQGQGDSGRVVVEVEVTLAVRPAAVIGCMSTFVWLGLGRTHEVVKLPAQMMIRVLALPPSAAASSCVSLESRYGTANFFSLPLDSSAASWRFTCPRPKQSQFAIEHAAGGKGKIRHSYECFLPIVQSDRLQVFREGMLCWLYQGGDAALERKEAQVDIDSLL
jgi:hypothetical protein